MITRDLPCTPIVKGQPTMLPFTGSDVGSFFIHCTMSDSHADLVFDGWTITHRATGFSAAKRIKTKAIAIKKAKELEALNCWDFTDPDHVKSFSPELMEKIKAIKGAS